DTTFPRDHVSDRNFVPLFVRAPDHTAFADVRMFEQHTFYLSRVNVLAPRYDEVLLAFVHPEVAIIIAQPNIASAIPAVVKRLAGCLPISPIFVEDIRPTHRNFPGCSR